MNNQSHCSRKFLFLWIGTISNQSECWKRGQHWTIDGRCVFVVWFSSHYELFSDRVWIYLARMREGNASRRGIRFAAAAETRACSSDCSHLLRRLEWYYWTLHFSLAAATPFSANSLASAAFSVTASSWYHTASKVRVSITVSCKSSWQIFFFS